MKLALKELLGCSTSCSKLWMNSMTLRHEVNQVNKAGTSLRVNSYGGRNDFLLCIIERASEAGWLNFEFMLALC